MLAGPSELLIVADEFANPDVLAADLLAQAEHDSDARPMLVTNSLDLIQNVNQAIQQQLKTLPTAVKINTEIDVSLKIHAPGPQSGLTTFFVNPDITIA